MFVLPVLSQMLETSSKLTAAFAEVAVHAIPSVPPVQSTINTPQRNDILERAQNLLSSYSSAGGKNPILLIHHETSGFEMIAAIARYGDGLPSNVIPFGVHATTSLGHIEITGMITSGASQIICLANPERPGRIIRIGNRN